MPDISDLINKTTTQIDKWYERNQRVSYNKYMAISELGEACSRKIWYRFRNYLPKEQFPGRLLRLFDTGNKVETRLITELQSFALVGRCQERVEACDGHLVGAIDAVVLGIPEAPKTEHLGEFKSHSDKNFKELQKHGVKEAFFKHYVQFSIYAHLLQIARWLYVALNKNDDMVYQERGETDAVLAIAQISRAERIIRAEEPPERIGKPDSFDCKFCQFHAICHFGAPHDVNYRNDGTHKPGENGTWVKV